MPKRRRAPAATRTADALLPMSDPEMEVLGWDALDVLLVSGDAYVDHPSFGAALISRLLEKQGYRVAILAQPDWRDPAAFRRLGRPRLAFLITAGNLDSMVSNYTVNRRRRKRDDYSAGGAGLRAGGREGFRPDRASILYTVCARQAYPGAAVVLGGLEASLRRLAHYDYWSDRVRRSLLLDAKADLLVYGMGERAITEIAALLSQGVPARRIDRVAGTVVRRSSLIGVADGRPAMLPSFEEVREDRRAFAESLSLIHI